MSLGYISVPLMKRRPDGFPEQVPCWAPSDLENVLAHIWCEKGHCAILAADHHSVAPDGKVMPSCVCPRDKCTWHVYATLEGWPGK